MKRSNRFWPVTLLLACVLAVISFTPLVIPEGRTEPTLAGIPVTLWVGVLIALAFVALTFVAGKVHPESRDSHSNGRDA